MIDTSTGKNGRKQILIEKCEESSSPIKENDEYL